MGLVINQTNARIGIETYPCRLDITTKPAQLDLRTKRIELNLHTELPKIQIDQHDAFASAGLKSVFDRSREYTGETRQHILEYIAKTAQDGKSYAAVENPVNAIAQIAKRDTFVEHEFGIVMMPSVRPEITVVGVQEFRPDINTGEGMQNGITGTFTPASVRIGFTPAQVRIYMQQYASMNISYAPGNSVNLQG